jgi:hypothetical protein
MRQHAEVLTSVGWDAVVARAVASDAVSHARWGQPGLRSAILRSSLGQEFLTSLREELTRRAEARISSNAETPGATRPFDDDPQLDTFFHRYLANELNQPGVAVRILTRMLGRGDGLAAEIVALLSAELDAAVGRLYGTPRADHSVSGGVGAGNFQQVMIDAARDPAAIFGPYFEADEDNIAASSATRQETLRFFLNQSRRQGKNREALSNAIRGARPAEHEWIPGNLASRVIDVTAEKMARAGETLTVRGAFALIRFQHEVRTPTSDLMFQPGSALPHLDRTINYLSPRHYQALLHGVEPNEEQLASYYEGLPAETTPVPAIQAHAGGLRAFRRSGAAISDDVRLEAASTHWHGLLEERIHQPLSDFALSDAELNQWRAPIVDFFQETIWQGAVPLPATQGARFDLYFLTSRQAVLTYEGLRSHAGTAYAATLANLNADMERVLG